MQQKHKAIFGNAAGVQLPQFISVDMQKTRFCDLKFRVGAGYIYCHQVFPSHIDLIFCVQQHQLITYFIGCPPRNIYWIKCVMHSLHVWYTWLSLELGSESTPSILDSLTGLAFLVFKLPSIKLCCLSLCFRFLGVRYVCIIYGRTTKYVP